MGTLRIEFTLYTGQRPRLFENARLVGSWDGSGSYSSTWSSVAMQEIVAEDGCPAFRASVDLNDEQVGWAFRWGVLADAPSAPHTWVIATEVADARDTSRHREFVLSGDAIEQAYFLTHSRRLGANKFHRVGSAEPEIRFSVWAPNARKVEVVLGDLSHGYISDSGAEVTATFAMVEGSDGIWNTDASLSPALRRFSDFDHRHSYMFRIEKREGATAYRTDLYSRCQVGSGRVDPLGATFSGSTTELDGSVSCSVVVDAERVMRDFDEPFPQSNWLSEEEFWQHEFDPQRPLPTRAEDLVIYELHVGGLGFGRTLNGENAPGTLADALALLDHLVTLGINAVELMPMSEFEGWASWGYGTSHYMAIEFAGGGRDHLKHFVRACHQRGIAVLLDVVYNHYHHHAERAEWMYDADTHENNIYYWYEGSPNDYPSYEAAASNWSDPNRPTPQHGGYVDNVSTGYAPRYWDENVRKMFISSGAALLTEFHLDGFRLDQTTSIHAYNVLHADGRAMPAANSFGIKLLREWTRTMRLLKPNAFLIAEDHSNWPAVSLPVDFGGLGFDAVWYADFYHHLIGDTDKGSDYAKLLYVAARADGQPLALDYFAGALRASRDKRIVYHESHDEAGNAKYSTRTLCAAVNDAPLFGATRAYAEHRTRFAAGMSLLAAGTPMFFMGEEVGFEKKYKYDTFLDNKEDFAALRAGPGAKLFYFYQDLIRLRRSSSALRSRELDVLYTHSSNRVLAFRRKSGSEELLIFASLNDTPYGSGYVFNGLEVADASWKEVFNSDASVYGGANFGNQSGTLNSRNGTLSAIVPGPGFVVFLRL